MGAFAEADLRLHRDFKSPALRSALLSHSDSRLCESSGIRLSWSRSRRVSSMDVDEGSRARLRGGCSMRTTARPVSFLICRASQHRHHCRLCCKRFCYETAYRPSRKRHLVRRSLSRHLNKRMHLEDPTRKVSLPGCIQYFAGHVSIYLAVTERGRAMAPALRALSRGSGVLWYLV